ncbi:rRNA maturation RNase YbeY [Gilvimarinus agarilyticus]|uniref:rRNA maturation RNase YbeY n=1 Tax=Gilvimarinus agarilyticus TaxID=679259 RepID=UPI00059FC3C7|nr:rRNA maturation RNase YbeY [Gilvimarinus agarilyticus]
MTQVHVDIDRQVDSEAVPGDDEVHRWVTAALRNEREVAEVSVCIVDPATSADLNHRYRGKNYPTNVLSFPADLPAELGLPLLGDLVVCADVVAREAREQGKTADAHWAHMLVHGTLHLLGYDHIEEHEAEAMEALETDIVTALGFAPPYTEITQGQATSPAPQATLSTQESTSPTQESTVP